MGKLTLKEYVEEVLDEYVAVAIEFGRCPTEENELALCEAAELLYNALELKEKQNK